MTGRDGQPSGLPRITAPEIAFSAAHAIEQLCRDAAIAVTVYEHVAVCSIADANALVPELTDNLIKTLAFEIAKTPRIALVGIDSASDVDYSRVSRLLGCSRRALRLMPADRVERELGFEIGGVGPFRVLPQIEVLLDDHFAPQTDVRVGAGLRTRTLGMKFSDLVRINQAQLGALSKTADKG